MDIDFRIWYPDWPYPENVFKKLFPKRPLGLRVFSTRFGSDDVCGYGYVGACRVGSGR